MPARKKVSVRQMELLLEFVESHQDIALGRFPAGPLGNQAARRQWESIAVQLNSVVEGTIKNADQWRRYWIEYKAKTKAKASDFRRYASGTGGGPSKLVPLNAFEERVLALIGPVAVEGLPSVRLPINVPPTVIPVPDPAHTETQVPPSNPSLTTSPSHPLQLQCSSETNASQGSIETVWLQVGDSQTPSAEICSQPSQSIIPPESSVQAEQEFERVEVEAQPEELQPCLVPQPQPAESLSEEPQPEPPQPSQGTRRRRALRRNRLHEGVPRWAYDLETRRIAVEERNADTFERFLAVAEQIASDIRQIRENITRDT